MKKIITICFLFLLPIFGCGSNQGGTEAGNPPTIPTRNVVGTVSSNSTSSLTKTASDDCAIDKVIATDSQAQTTQATLEDDCFFTLSLAANKAYSLGFVEGDEFVATMIFNNSSTSITSSTFIISEGEQDIDLGIITIDGSLAVPQNEPSTQNDQDEDGISDFDDEDDDGDGVEDDFEEDCDFDGYYDDYDDEDEECEGDEEEEESEDGEETPEVLEVYPNDGDTDIEIDEDIEVRFGCEVNEDSLTSETFIVESETGEQIECTFHTENSGSIVVCEHEEDFQLLAEYTVTLENIECANEEVIATTSWSFTTSDE